MRQLEQLPAAAWKKMRLHGVSRRYRNVRYTETSVALRGLSRALRADIDDHGAYEVLLGTAPALSSGVSVGRFNNTTGLQWERREFVFTTPADANARPWIIFKPVAAGADQSAYPGLDSLSLTTARP